MLLRAAALALLPMLAYPPAVLGYGATSGVKTAERRVQVCQAADETTGQRELDQPDARQRALEMGDDVDRRQDELEQGNQRQRDLEAPDQRQQELDTPGATDQDGDND